MIESISLLPCAEGGVGAHTLCERLVAIQSAVKKFQICLVARDLAWPLSLQERAEFPALVVPLSRKGEPAAIQLTLMSQERSS